MINLLEWLDKLAGRWLQWRYDWACRHMPEIKAQVEQLGLKSVNTIPGGWEATFVTPAAAMIAADMAGMLDKAQAKNFIQFDFMPRLDRGMKAVRVTVEWADGESPAQKAERLEREIERVKDELAEAREWNEMLGLRGDPAHEPRPAPTSMLGVNGSAEQ
jgi:hypothetical protein